MQAELATFKPMYLDPTISTDYCLVDGEITAILGTTHFVTDVYRECFYYMNAWLCDKELAHLHTDGFNVLRSGNWVHIPAFYNEDGSIGKRGVRALQTYFILAARYGFTVQFALGTVLLNQWDRNRSPIHDGGMREKCMTLIRSFVESEKYKRLPETEEQAKKQRVSGKNQQSDMKIEYSHIPAEKFRFVQQGKRLLDDGPATKQRGYFRDALHRFCKDKSAVTAAVIIFFIIVIVVTVANVVSYKKARSKKQ